MRIRYPFAAAFGLLVFSLGYVGLAPFQVSPINDKVLHLVAFFLLTSTFYWAIEAPRRFLLKTAFSICTVLLSVGSEFAQAFLPNERSFDPIDIVANVVGSLLALTLCSWYHGRMLERKRRRKLEGRGLLNDEFEERDDLELGEGGASGQEIGLQERSGEGDEETAEAWDEIGGSEGGSEVAGHGAVAKAAKD